MDNINLNIYKDGNRTIVVFENTDSNFEAILAGVFKSILGEKEIEIADVPDLVPPMWAEEKEKENINALKANTVLFPEGSKYFGKNVETLITLGINVGDIVAEINFLQDKELKSSLKNELLTYIYDRYKDYPITNDRTKEEFVDFISNYKSFLGKDINAILQQAGYKELSDYINMESTTIQLSAYKALKQKLVEKCKKNIF